MSLTQAALTVATGYFCLLGPGMAWWHPRASSLPRALAWAGLSVVWTTLAGLVLASFEVFSVPLLVLVNAVVSLVGYTTVGRLRSSGHAYSESGWGGAVVAVGVVLLLWPPFETHLGSQDATTYTAAGIHLARSGQLSKTDELVEDIPPRLRRLLFRSVYGLGPRPPFARMPGGMVTESPDSALVRPSFVPAPYVWTALFAQTLGEPKAGGYAALFSALALWSCWQFCRRRMGHAASLATMGLLALNPASYWAGRFALSEPMAMFFFWTGLAALDAFEEEGFGPDALLAGLLLGATSIARIEFLIFVPIALAARELLARAAPVRRLGAGFYLPLFGMMAAACLEAASMPAAYTATLGYIIGGANFRLLVWAEQAPLLPIFAALAAATTTAGLAWLALRRFGLKDSLLVGLPLAAALYYALAASDQNLPRSLGWMESTLGWPALVLATAGVVVAWKGRFQRPGNLSFVVLVGTVSLFVLYDPHVMPEMIWGSRRLIVVVVPAAIIMAALAACRFGGRSLLAGLMAWTLLMGSVFVGRPAISAQDGRDRTGITWQPSTARFLWGQDFYRGNYAQLEELAGMLPADSVLLIDDRLANYILGTPLWLIHDRQSVPVSVWTKRGRLAAAMLVRALGWDRELFLIKPTLTTTDKPLPFIKSELAGSMTLQTLQPRRVHGWPRYGELYTMPVSFYRVEPIAFPNRAARK